MRAQLGQPPDGAAALALGPVSSAPGDIDWADEVRIAIEERVAMSPARSPARKPTCGSTDHPPIGHTMGANEAVRPRQHRIDPEVCIRCNTGEATGPTGAVTHDSRKDVVDADKGNFGIACVPPCPTGSVDSWRVVPRVRAGPGRDAVPGGGTEWRRRLRQTGAPKRCVPDLMRGRGPEPAALLQGPDTAVFDCGRKAMEEGVLLALRDAVQAAGASWDTVGHALRIEGRLHLETY